MASTDELRPVAPSRGLVIVLGLFNVACWVLSSGVPLLAPWLGAPRIAWVCAHASVVAFACVAAWMGRNERGWTRADEVAWAIALGAQTLWSGSTVHAVGVPLLVHAMLLIVLAVHQPTPLLLIVAAASAAVVPVLHAATRAAWDVVIESLVLVPVLLAAFLATGVQTRRFLIVLRERALLLATRPAQPARETPSVRARSSRLPARAEETAHTHDSDDGWDGLVERVRSTVAAIAEPSGVTVDVRSELRGLAAPTTKLRTQLLRIAQDAINQTIRSASPRSVTIILRRGEGGVLLEISDDGSEGDTQRHRRGLASLRGRVAALGGTAEVRRGDVGWVTRVRVPYEQLN